MLYWAVCVSTVVQVLQIWQTGSASEILASTMLASASQFYIISFIRCQEFCPHWHLYLQRTNVFSVQIPVLVHLVESQYSHVLVLFYSVLSRSSSCSFTADNSEYFSSDVVEGSAGFTGFSLLNVNTFWQSLQRSPFYLLPIKQLSFNNCRVKSLHL